VIAPARLAACKALRAVNSGAADLPVALARVRSALRDERDRALAGEIVTGTLRWQGAFDRVISVFSGRPLDRLDPEVLDILRLTLFQLLHLDRVPASAAVNDGVQLTRKVGKSSSASFVNAVLRRASRERAVLPLPPRTVGDAAAELDYLETTLSHPRWLVERWRDRYGFEAAEAWCRFNNAPASLTLRANRLRVTRESLGEALRAVGVETTPTHFAPDGLVVQRGNPLSLGSDLEFPKHGHPIDRNSRSDPEIGLGSDLEFAGTPGAGSGKSRSDPWFVVQDEASQLVAVMARATAGERVLDACAAPGGKTTAMAADMGDRGLLIASDVRSKRVRLLAQTVRNSGAQCVRVIQANAAQPLPFADAFDLVLIDAPCSGLGTLRRDPDIKWRRSADEFSALSSLQLRILTSAAAVVRTGGRILYSTCSSEIEENDEVVERFLARHSGFRRSPLQFPVAPELVESDGYFRTLPFRDGLEAFFAASLVKAG
jgi:16S rRNA (cytosine967-C5)-methyltransferase